jgi:hypothetical protein
MPGFRNEDHPRGERGRFEVKPHVSRVACCVWCSLTGALAGAAVAVFWIWLAGGL